MNVFVLCTGRSGSVTFVKACKHITNFSADHESRTRVIGEVNLDFPKDHIEADNRLSWHLGKMDKVYGDDAFYVHLTRDRDKTAQSFMRRFNKRGSIVKSYSEGIKIVPPELLNKAQRLEICYEYVDCVTNNIDHFLKDKSKVMRVDITELKDRFTEFWNAIGAEGDLEAALGEFDKRHNASSNAPTAFSYTLKLFFYRLISPFR